MAERPKLEKLDKCLLCGAGDFLGLEGIRIPSDGTKRSLDLGEDETSWYMCQRCSFMFQNPRLERNHMKEWYARSGFRHDSPEISQGQIGYSQIQLARFEPYLYMNGIKIADMRNATCLDYGCGIGGALNVLAERGNEVWGVELDRREVEFGRRHYKVKFVHGLDELPPDLRFDFIFSHHAMEHVFDPNEFLAHVSRILKPDGLLMIAVPTWRYANTMRMINGFSISDNSMFDHVSMAGFLNKHGMYQFSHLYQNIEDWELAVLARKSARKNYFSFSLEETLAELYVNPQKRDRERLAEGAAGNEPIVVRM